MSTNTSNTPRTRDRYEPEQQGMRNIAARDGYDPGDGFQVPNPQVWNSKSTASPSTYLPSSYSRRRSSIGEEPEGYRTRQTDAYRQQQYANWGREYSMPRRGRSAPRGRDYDEESDSDSEYDERDRALAKRRASTGRASSRGRSRSGIRQKIQEMFGPDESEMGKDNSEAKKWAATVAGAVAGGFAAHTAKKDHWVPAALGAFIGGLTAREAEKAFYLHRDSKDKEMQAYEGRRSHKD